MIWMTLMTADLFTTVTREMDKDLWFLKRTRRFSGVALRAVQHT